MGHGAPTSYGDRPPLTKADWKRAGTPTSSSGNAVAGGVPRDHDLDPDAIRENPPVPVPARSEGKGRWIVCRRERDGSRADDPRAALVAPERHRAPAAGRRFCVRGLDRVVAMACFMA